MSINDILQNLILTSSAEFIEDISSHLLNGSFSGKGFEKINDLFATTHNNQSKRNDADFEYFYDKVAFVDFCNFNNMKPNKLTSKYYLAASYNQNTHEFSYDSRKFYKPSTTPLKTILILNVKGKDIYKVLNALYTKFKDAGVDNCITIPSFNRFEEGITDSIRIYINDSDIERVVSLIGELPLPIINLMDRPSILYPRVNDYIGYDSLISSNDNTEIRKSSIICDSISKALFKTVSYFVDQNGNESIENGAETILDFRNKSLEDESTLLENNLRILQRVVTIDPSNKEIFINNLKEELLGNTLTKSAYFTLKDHEAFNLLFGKLDDESILIGSGEFEMPVEPPKLEVEASTDLLVPSEQSNDLMVSESTPDDLMIRQDYPADLLVQDTENLENTATSVLSQDNMAESFSQRAESTEAYLDSLLASVTSPQGAETPEESEEEQILQDNLHVYEESPQVGDNFVVSSNPAETTVLPADELPETQEVPSSNDLVRPEDMTDEQRNFVNNTLEELGTANSKIADILDKLSSFGDLSEETIQEVPSDSLSTEEASSLADNSLDQQIAYERALKYKDLIPTLSILNTKVKGTDFTLLDYFDQQDLLSRVKPDAFYSVASDKVYTGAELVEECVIRYVDMFGNVPLGKIFEEYDVQPFLLMKKEDKPKGFRGLFRRKK